MCRVAAFVHLLHFIAAISDRAARVSLVSAILTGGVVVSSKARRGWSVAGRWFFSPSTHYSSLLRLPKPARSSKTERERRRFRTGRGVHRRRGRRRVARP